MRSPGLDTLSVKFRVNFPYRTKPEDLVVAVEAVNINGTPWTLVTQKITNLLWFFHRISRYQDRCVIESPESIRQIRLLQLKNEIKAYEGKI